MAVIDPSLYATWSTNSVQSLEQSFNPIKQSSAANKMKKGFKSLFKNSGNRKPKGPALNNNTTRANLM